MLGEDEVTNILQKVSEGRNFLSQSNSTLVKRVIAYLQVNYSQQLSLKEIAHTLGVSKNHLGEIFHREIGISLWDYLTRYRVKEARFLSEITTLNVTTIAIQVGFDDSAYFSKVFRTITGQSPTEYRSVQFKMSHRNLSV